MTIFGKSDAAAGLLLVLAAAGTVGLDATASTAERDGAALLAAAGVFPGLYRHHEHLSWRWMPTNPYATGDGR